MPVFETGAFDHSATLPSSHILAFFEQNSNGAFPPLRRGGSRTCYTFSMNTIRLDHQIIHFLRRASVPFARFAIFVIYSWFGILKILGLSPASLLVHHLFDASFVHAIFSFHVFYILFALFEVLIGIMFLFPKMTRYVFPLLVIHLITTVLPLVLLPKETWNGFLVPTLEGQYIIKNLLIIALAIGIAAHVHPLPNVRKSSPS